MIASLYFPITIIANHNNTHPPFQLSTASKKSCFPSSSSKLGSANNHTCGMQRTLTFQRTLSYTKKQRIISTPTPTGLSAKTVCAPLQTGTQRAGTFSLANSFTKTNIKHHLKISIQQNHQTRRPTVSPLLPHSFSLAGLYAFKPPLIATMEVFMLKAYAVTNCSNNQNLFAHTPPAARGST